MAGETILVVDDEIGIRELIKLYLIKKKYTVCEAKNGQEAIDLVKYEQVDLILLDIEMPGMNGFETCKAIRAFSSVPILFVSCKKEITDRIEGIEIGADDYITKPFDFHEFESRIEAVLRRGKWIEISTSSETSPILKFGDIEIDPVKCELVVRGEKVPLSSKEYTLLILMAKQPNRIWAADQLYDQVWGYYSEGSPQTVKVHISNLRKKLEVSLAKPKYIQTTRGFGYKFVASPS